VVELLDRGPRTGVGRLLAGGFTVSDGFDRRNQHDDEHRSAHQPIDQLAKYLSDEHILRTTEKPASK
jgi:hypothetical protein